MARDRDTKREIEPAEPQAIEFEEAPRKRIARDDSDEYEKPFCPRCGWHNTRPSFSHTALDTLLQVVGLRPYRCRACGNRFRALRRRRKDPAESTEE